MTTAPQVPEPPDGVPHRVLITFCIVGATLMQALDQTIANVALPYIRAVQRSIYDTHSEDGTDAAKGDAMASVCDIVNAIEAQDVGGERAQACKDAGIASDAAGVFCEATVADVVIAVVSRPEELHLRPLADRA